jgi:NADH dehydrogenase FAD-containing subunit/uncharacterized membrane protein YphA (DoxX/SURF4 family)
MKRFYSMARSVVLVRAPFIADLAAPFVDLLIRAWLAQLFWMTGLAALTDWPLAILQVKGFTIAMAMQPGHVAALLTAVRLVMPPLLLIGFGTRLAALPLLMISLTALHATPLPDVPLLWVLLTGWYVTIGAGSLSVDRIIARGIYDTALPFAPAVGRFAASLSRAARPIALLLVRTGIAFVFLRHGMIVSQAAQVLPALLVAGLATRLAVLPLLSIAGTVTMHEATNQHLCLTLLLLLVLSAGPGVLSLDGLLRVTLRARFSKLMFPPQPSANLPHIVVVGGGFGGVAAVRALRHTPCTITLVDQHNYHLFQPLLYQVATASLSPADIATPIRTLFREQSNVRVVLGRVDGIDPSARALSLAGEPPLHYTMLILATGARHSYFGHDDWDSAAPGLKTLDDATLIRRRLLLAFERAETATDPGRRTAFLTFGVIGGGPTGVELAGAIAELARHGLAREFRTFDPAQSRVLLIQGGERLLPTFPRALSEAALRALEALGVEVRLGAAVEAVDAMGLSVGGERIQCGTTFWAAGVRASPAASWLDVPGDRAGRLIAARDLTVPGHPDIFAVGDTASVDAWNGRPVPGLAPAAKQAGQYAARVIAARLAGHGPPPPFRYRHGGSLATVGRRAAVAEFGPLRVAGPFAWWLWGAVHILFLAGARNRFIVVAQWFWAYLTFGRGIRLITGLADQG